MPESQLDKKTQWLAVLIPLIVAVGFITVYALIEENRMAGQPRTVHTKGSEGILTAGPLQLRELKRRIPI